MAEENLNQEIPAIQENELLSNPLRLESEQFGNTEQLPDDGLDLGTYDLPDAAPIAPIDESSGSIKVGGLALGGAGGRVWEAMARLKYSRGVAVNTADQDLKDVNLPNSQKLLLRSAEGGGAGKDMAAGAAAFDAHRDEVYEMAERTWGDIDQIVITLGAGGGTGGGALAGAVALAARYVNEHIRDYKGDKVPAGERISVVVALPGKVERKVTGIANNAREVLQGLQNFAESKQVANIIVADNEFMEARYRRYITASNKWAFINDRIAEEWHFFNRVSTQSSPIAALDAANWANVCRVHGFAIMGRAAATEATSEAVRRAVRDDLPRTVLCGGFDLKTAQAGCMVIVAGAEALDTPGSDEAFDAGYSNLCELAPDATLHKGIYQGGKPGVMVHAMVSGMKLSAKVLAELGRY